MFAPGTTVFAIPCFVVSGMLLVWWPAVFWVVFALVIAASLWAFWSLRHAPRIELPGLSPTAQDVLERYNHAWSAPALTRLSSFILTVSQFVCLGSVIYFAVHHQFKQAGVVVVGLLVQSFLVGAVDPSIFIRKHNLGEEARELADAYVIEMHQRRHPRQSAHKRDG
jgi:hypothetical protein